MIGILPRFPRLTIYALSSRYVYKKDARTYGHPILKWAAENRNQYTACKWLGEISATDLGGENDIHEQMTDAAMYGNEAVVQIFLENGASLNDGNTLYWAIVYRHLSVASTLLAHGVKTWWDDSVVLCEAINLKEPLAMVKLLVEEGNYNPKDNHCDTPALSEAAALGKAETVEYLLQKGCDVETRDGPACETPICLAAEHGHVATVCV